MQFSTLLRFDTCAAQLRAIAFLEGVSYLLLLLVGMPLKYLAGLPLGVRILGSGHGVLFVALCLLILEGMLRRGRSIGWGLRIGVASLVPFGTFLLDAELLAEDEAQGRPD
ncbi:MAG: integral membrane protein [Planctomycetota bacterium]|jgi:integral membrane protein